MITSLLVAIIYIAIICVLVYGLLAVVKALGVTLPPIVPTVVNIIVAVICLLVLLGVVTGNFHGPLLRGL